jgi:hypothetical protein
MSTKRTVQVTHQGQWSDPNGVVHVALFNDVDGHFLQMCDGTTVLSNAYPRCVWEKMGWFEIKPLDPVTKALKDLE